jgi:hypothetical protein
MAINATNQGTVRELIPAGNYIARCYSMIQIGTVTEVIEGTPKTMSKVRIGWELPTETKVFKEERGPEPLVISKEYTLSMNEKANLRKALASWRGKDFTEEEAKKFDVSKLLGASCMLNVIHKPAKSGKTYEEIGSISPMPKGVECPAAINKPQVLEYDNWNEALFQSLPDFIKDKIKTSEEYRKMAEPTHTALDPIVDPNNEELDPFKEIPQDDVPF